MVTLHSPTLYRIGAKSEDGSRGKGRGERGSREEGTQTAEHTHAPLSNPAAGDGKGGSAERLPSADCSTWNAGLSRVEAVGTERGAIWNIYRDGLKGGPQVL